MEDIDKIRDQFNTLPYYNAPLAATPKVDYSSLYIHNMVTAFYRRDQQVIDTAGKVILDAGCGSGYKSLTLAEANPGAKIVGIDLSEKSVGIARERLKLHGFTDAEFHVMPIENIGTLEYEFDYINCDEVLYLFSDIIKSLTLLKSVLKYDGILRANLHSKIQRSHYYRSQRIWKKLGLMDSAPQEADYNLVREAMQSLKPGVFLKEFAWKNNQETSNEYIARNHLLIGDRGFEIPDLFDGLRQSGLEFVGMVHASQWDLLGLFEHWDELPIALMVKFSELSTEEQLHIHELFHSQQRLLDFWCGHPQGNRVKVKVEEWTQDQWNQATVHFHPQLRTETFKHRAIASITQMSALPLYDYLSIDPENRPLIDSVVVSLLLPLVDAPCTFRDLVGRSQKLYPVDPVSGEAIGPSQATQKVKELLIPLYEMGYVLLES
ncbi:class I SAM-dependent methyltransferase [Roseofilum sp. BLCC_M154]|uniref:Class I SAM-dependent methyltransferase n=1 Tax=Roseofilum acuticapitatum BLCC-M154 TaxID=3022444 RepID=A0ABT7ALX2_9CYAN|nr:class I SAM-dependent methyltransferase [Roseofilum acuticapitatum]MDJ1167891.1 class I SAM-dependent methyltransferase [Roseofilum acuticapitatum BLCC-M154]